MKRSLVHFVLGLLICITSVQGVAAGLPACCGALFGEHGSGPARQHAGHRVQEGGAAHAAPSPLAQHEAHAGQACSACAACCNVPAMPPQRAFKPSPMHTGAGSQAAVRPPADHVPDAPERPPRRHAV